MKIFEDIWIKICIEYETERLKNYFSFKDSINSVYGSCIVYKLTFPSDSNHQYIDETKQKLSVRIKKYKIKLIEHIFKQI